MQKHVSNIFSEEQINYLKNYISDELSKRTVYVWDEHKTKETFPEEIFMDPSRYLNNVSLGKIILELKLRQDIKDRVVEVARSAGFDVEFFDATYTEYSSKYGRPNLESHTDFQHFCLMDYQLEANTSWPLYIEDQTYDLKDNDSIIFIPSKLVHGRIDKEFEDTDVVKMIFFDMTFNSEPIETGDKNED